MRMKKPDSTAIARREKKQGVEKGSWKGEIGWNSGEQDILKVKLCKTRDRGTGF